MHISSSYAKVLWETNFRTREIPRSGSKAKYREKKRKKKERLNDGNNNGQATHGARKPPGPKTKVANNNGQLCIATPPRVAHAKPPGPTMACFASSATTGGACKHGWTKRTCPCIFSPVGRKLPCASIALVANKY